MELIDVLLVEDNRGDVVLVEKAFEERELPATLHSVQTGDEALDWLYRRGDFSDAPRPDVVLLDLNLPATSGHTVLETVKADSTLKRLPVVVLTSSRSSDDLTRAYEEYANACLIKSVDPEEFADRLEAFVEFWSSAVSLPPEHDDGDS